MTGFKNIMIDGDSINEIWEDFSNVLRGFIFSQVRDEAITDDILQEVFIKIIDNIGKLKDKTKLRAWLYQITRNAIIDHYRHHKTEVSIPKILEDVADEPEVEAQFSEELDPCIRALIERLPDKYKAAIELTEFEGLTQKEMGDRLGLSLAGAKSRAQRAREKLRQLLFECCSFEIDRRGNIIEHQCQSEDSPEVCKGKSGSLD
jgi:RNA polymerase sigma-70 factor (ECF subfamily)